MFESVAENRDACSLDDGTEEEREECLTRVEVAHYHGEVDTASNARCIVEELDTCLARSVGFH